ncbi:UNVERIFIED_CONTAM: hypothetical protein GTU68_031033 [Idotea baltica]|nr:hypothetical protein [Idotea baltica]
MAKQVRALKAEGKDIIGLTLGEPDFDTPEHIRAAGIQAIEDRDSHYPPVAGKPELRAAVAQRYQNMGLPYSAANVMISTGAKQSLVNLIMSLVNPGDQAIMPLPFWVSYREMLKMAEADIIELETTLANGYKLSPEELEAAITPKTRLFLLNNPSNPTGATYSEAELAGLVAVLERHPDVFIISDEIYEYITYDLEPTSMSTFASIRDRVAIVNGVSKAFAMTGWRIGFTIAPEWVIQLCEKYQGQITSGASTVSQRAATAAVSGDMAPTYAMRDAFRKRRDTLYKLLQEIEGLQIALPDGAFYFYPDLSAFIGKSTPEGEVLGDIDALAAHILDSGGLALIPGTAFGTSTHVRISYAYEMADLLEGGKRLKKCLEALT